MSKKIDCFFMRGEFGERIDIFDDKIIIDEAWGGKTEIWGYNFEDLVKKIVRAYERKEFEFQKPTVIWKIGDFNRTRHFDTIEELNQFVTEELETKPFGTVKWKKINCEEIK